MNTGEPLSPEPTPAETKVWQSCTMLLPCTPVLTHVWVTAPLVQPVARPILFTTVPTAKFGPRVSPVIPKLPTMFSELLLAPLVRAILPRVNDSPTLYAARDASLKRQRRPRGHPLLLLK